MRRQLCYARIAWCAGMLFAVPTFAQSVTFDGLPVGETFGPPEFEAGDVIHTENGISVTIEEFLNGAGVPVFFGPAQVFAAGDPMPGFPPGLPSGFGDGNVMFTPNVSLEFDLANVGPINQVAFEWANGGGNENISVNGEEIWFQSIVTAPTEIAPGVTLTASFDELTLVGTANLVGPIESLRVGGQEFAIDSIVAVPEPATLVCLAFGLVAAFSRRRKL